MEETGLTLLKFEYVGLVKFKSDIYEDEDMYLFLGTDFSGELISDCAEGTLEWIDLDEVCGLPTWEGDKYFLEALMKGRRNLNMTLNYEGDRLVEVEDIDDAVVPNKSCKINSPHGFSTRIGGVSDGIYKSLNLGMNRGDIKERVIENWRRYLNACDIGYRPIVCGEQVHGNTVHIATVEDAFFPYMVPQLIKADGYVTNVENLPLCIFSADCVPVLL